MKVTKCRACGAEIVFIPTLTTKSMPCNAQEVLYKAVEGGKERIVLPNGSVVSGVLVNDASEATGMGYISHFATCTDPGRFRRRDKQNERRK